MVYQFQASIVGLESFPRRKKKGYRFDFLHDMSNNLKPGQAIRLVVPSNSIGQSAKKVWMRIKGKGIPCTKMVRHGIDQFLIYLWFENVKAEPLNNVSYLARVTLIRELKEGERIDRLY